MLKCRYFNGHLHTWYLGFHQHGDVGEHLVQLPDAGLQVHDVMVPRLDLAQGATRRLGVLGHLRGKSDGVANVLIWNGKQL